MPDSVKNNKEIKRKRSSMRCDCKWRITLFQTDDAWFFRKAVNPASMEHNHPLTSPEEIRQPWPPGVFDRIAFYAKQKNLSTSDTREKIKEDFPGLIWDERRFYNRLTEERKQIRHRETESRVFTIMDLAAKVASLASSDSTVSAKVMGLLEGVLNDLCEQLRLDPAGTGTRVMTSPPSSAGGGGSGGAGSSMAMTSPISTSPGFCPSSSSPPQNSSDYMVAYPGCVISVKSTSSQKGRPSSMSSPIVDPSYGLGLGASAMNDRKRSLSEDCFSRATITGGPSATTSTFGSAIGAPPPMMGHLDMSTATGAIPPLANSLSALDTVMPGSSGLLMMQGGGYHAHPAGTHPHQQQQQHPQGQPHQPLQYHQQDPQLHHSNHHLPSGMPAPFRHASFSQASPSQSHHHQHPSHHHHHQQPPTGLSPENLSDMSLEIDSCETPRQEPAPMIKRAHSMDIKQEFQFYQPVPPTPPIATNSQMARRASGSPIPGGPARLYSHAYPGTAAVGVVPHSGQSSQQMQQAIHTHPGFHSGQLMGGGEPDDVFTNPVAFPTAPNHYSYNSGNNGSYLHPGYPGQPTSNSSPTMNAPPQAFGQHDRVRL